MRPTAYIVDDHPGFRAAAALVLADLGYDVVGTAPEGAAALSDIARSPVDLILLDLRLPGVDGVDISHRLARSPRPPRVVLVSSREDAADDPRVRGAPVVAFVAKRDLSPATLRDVLG